MYFIIDMVPSENFGLSADVYKNMLLIFVLAVGIPLAVLLIIRIIYEKKNEINIENKNEEIHVSEHINDCPEKYSPTEEDMQNIGLKLQKYLDTNDEKILIDNNIEKTDTEKGGENT